MQIFRLIIVASLMLNFSLDSFSQEKIFHENGNMAYNPFNKSFYYKSGSSAYTPINRTMYYPNGKKLFSGDYKNIYYENGNVVYNNLNKNIYYFDGETAYDSRNKVVFNEKGEKIFAFTDVNNAKESYTFSLKNFKIVAGKNNKCEIECVVNDSSYLYKTDFRTYYKITKQSSETVKEVFLNSW